MNTHKLLISYDLYDLTPVPSCQLLVYLSGSYFCHVYIDLQKIFQTKAICYKYICIWFQFSLFLCVRARASPCESGDQKRALFTQLLDAASALSNRQGKLQLTWLSLSLSSKEIHGKSIMIGKL